ncbi:MAG: phenylalanine--tRNA ligase subunit beta [Candidatus Gracilibacteria bacterium]|nr:phenylalanine--tRNA ligase subunit beta [Candidatus Gracilibacteria bacterium]
MKISYNVLKKYIPEIGTPEEVAQDLIMHTAEVEGIEYEGSHLENVFIGFVKTCEKHPDSEKLNCTTVEVNGNTYPIVCGAPNVKAGLKVAVALVGAQLAPDFTIAKTKIRGEVSEGMICSEDELGMTDVRQEGILELPDTAPVGVSMREYLEKNDAILEIDNKAINHRPDLFSHIGIAREVSAISGNKLDYTLSNRDFSKLPDLGITNEIPQHVSRYKGLKIENVKNIDSPEYIKQVLDSADVTSKGLLIDISNYSLYLYGQPTHCFDADKIDGKITIRFAEDGEKFIALNDTQYELSHEDIVIADNKSVLALGGIIGGKYSSVSDSTKNIIVESAHFDQAIIRKTGKKLGVRTDSLNVFEKDLVNGMQLAGMSLIADELEKNIPELELTAYTDHYKKPQEEINIPYDQSFIQNLIGKEYSEAEIIDILTNLGIKKENNNLLIPFWRKDLKYKSDIAEEIARINGYNNIESTVPQIHTGAVIQNNIYKIKNDSRNYFTDRGFFDMYTYSFVNSDLLEKLGENTEYLVPMKNPLSEELTHLKGSHIPSLVAALEKNIRDYKKLQLFEIEKVFSRKGSEVGEYYSMAGVIMNDSDLAYYDMQNTVSDFFKTVGISNFHYDTPGIFPTFSHKGRTASIVIRGQEVGIIGEIHPKYANNFGLQKRIGFFEINVEKIENALFSKVKANDLSEFQANHFDLNFVVNKDIKGKDIHTTIEKSDQNLIQKVELIDIYESDEKLPGKRSLTFKIYIQSMEKTLDDSVKNKLIEEIVKKVAKRGGELR